MQFQKLSIRIPGMVSGNSDGMGSLESQKSFKKWNFQMGGEVYIKQPFVGVGEGIWVWIPASF